MKSMFYALSCLNEAPRRALSIRISVSLACLAVATAIFSPAGRAADTEEAAGTAASVDQEGTADVDSFPTPENTEPLSPDSPQAKSGQTGPSLPSAAEAAAGIRFDRPGFDVRVMASEPDVQNPIDMAWDRQGRVWIAENYTYAQSGVRFRDDLRDRVVVLTDDDLDGVHDRREVFIDTVQKLTSVEVGRGGVWLMAPPQLLFVPDADGDLKPDGPIRVVLDGFTVAQSNYHNFANGLRFGPDGWLYGRCGGSCPGRVGKPGTADEDRTALEGGIWRYNVDNELFETICHGTTNPWGHDFTQLGELFFINTVNGHLWHGITGSHLKRPFTLDPNPNAYQLIDQHADHYHFDTGASWMDSRDGAANDYGGGHAHTGMMIYQETTWPEPLRDELYTLNFHGRRANRESLHRQGTGFVGTHNPDLFLTSDVWFRGMELSAGPDGNVVLLDWSDLGECHEHTGVHRTSGRVFTLRHENTPPVETTRGRLNRLASDDPEVLVEFQFQPDRWFSHQARLRLVALAHDGQDVTGVYPTLRAAVADTGSAPAQRLRALWTLHQLSKVQPDGGIDRDDLVRMVQADPDVEHESIRVWAIRLLTEDWPLDDCYGPTATSRAAADRVTEEYKNLRAVLQSAAKTDPSGLVRSVLASTLQRLPIDQRPELAVQLCAAGEPDVGDHNQEKLIWYGLMSCADEYAGRLVQVAASSPLPETNQMIARAVAERIQEQPQAFASLLAVATAKSTSNPKWLDSVFQGIEKGLVGIRQVDPPPSFPVFAEAMQANADLATKHAKILARLDSIFGEGLTAEELMAAAGEKTAPVMERQAAYQGLIQTLTEDGEIEPATFDQVLELTAELIRDSQINVGIAESAATIQRPEIGRLMLENYRRFRSPQRPKVVMLLCSRPLFADQLLTAIESEQLDKSVLTASHVRSLLSLGDASIETRVESAWGKLRESPQERLDEIHRLKDQLTRDRLATADLSAGRVLFEKTCANCHQMYGRGGKIGPNLTGAQRDNMDYWLHNIVDPDAVVSADYRATQVLTEDGRILVGLVTERTRRTITLVSAEQTWTLADDEILESRMMNQSPMPSGLLQTFDDDQTANLIGYLSHPTQVALPEGVQSPLDMAPPAESAKNSE